MADKTIKKDKHIPILDNCFTMDFSSDWRENTIYTFEGPEDMGIKHRLMVTIEDDVEIKDLSEYSDRKISELSNELPEYEDLNRGIIRLKGGLLAYNAIYKWCPNEFAEVYQRVQYVLKDNTAYALTVTFSKETFAIYGEEVDEMFKSFHVPDNKLG